MCVCVLQRVREELFYFFSPVMSKAVKISWHLESCDGIMRTNDLRIPAVCAHKCVFVHGRECVTIKVIV